MRLNKKRKTITLFQVLNKTFPDHTFLMNGLVMGIKGILSFLSAPLIGAVSYCVWISIDKFTTHILYLDFDLLISLYKSFFFLSLRNFSYPMYGDASSFC